MRLAEAQHADPVLAVRARIALLEAPGECGHLALRLFGRHPRLEHANRRDVPRGTWCVIRGTVRHVELGSLRELEAWGHHADDGARALVDDYAPSDNRRIGAVAALPQTVRQDDRRLEARHGRLLGEEVAAQHRLDPEQREQVGRDRLAQQPLGIALARHREIARQEAGDAVEGSRLALQVQQIRIRDPRVVPVLRLQAMRRVQGDDAVAAIAKRQRTQQQRIDDAEDRDVGANADGQRDERGQREARALT